MKTRDETIRYGNWKDKKKEKNKNKNKKKNERKKKKNDVKRGVVNEST